MSKAEGQHLGQKRNSNGGGSYVSKLKIDDPF